MNITDAERKILNAVADAMKIPDQFGAYEDDDYIPGMDCVEDRVEKVLGRDKFYSANGVSKYVIVPENLNCVLKTPLGGMWYEEWDDEIEEGGENYDFHRFEYANDFGCDADADDDDYCENELIKYENACEAGFGDFFAETEFFGYHNGSKFYLQEKVTSLSNLYGEGWRSPSEESVKTYKAHRDQLCCCVSSYWVTRAIEWFGLERTIEFIKYMEDARLDQDLHDGNVGFTAAGKPVLLDWSGWRD